jgi:outer membrane receptor protein involved in Fe transport
MSATVLYNIVGRRIVSAAELGLPNVYEEARNVLDVSLRFPVLGGISAKLDAKNLLNEPYEVTQGVATREYFEAGRVFTFGLTWHR